MKVADLFALLGLKPDTASWRLGDKLIDRTKSGLVSLKDAASEALGNAFSNIASAIKSGVDESLKFQTSVARLNIASKGALGDIEGQMLDVSDATGVAREEIQSGAAQYVSLTGDVDGASKSIETFSKVSQASGAEMNDVAGAAAAMGGNMEIASEDFEEGFSILIAGGKAGAVELKDMSKELAKAAPLAAQFAGGKGLGGLRKLGAAFQLVRRGTGTAAETTTRLVALQGALIGNSAKLEKVKGVKVFNVDAKTGVKTLREFDAIVADIAKSDLVKDPAKLQKALGSKEALLAFLQLQKVDEEWVKLADSTIGAKDVAEDYATFMASTPAVIGKAWNKVRNAIFKVVSVVLDGLAAMIKRWKLFTTLFASLALAALIQQLIVAFAALQAASVRAAIASAASWVLAALPFVLLAVGIFALILIVEDLWVAFNGGESVFRDLFLAAQKWLGKVADEVDLAGATVADFLGFDDKAEAIRNRVRTDRSNERGQQREKAQEEGETLQQRIRSRDKSIENLERRFGNEGIDNEILNEQIGRLRKERNELQRLQDVQGPEFREAPEQARVGLKAPGVARLGDPSNPLTEKFLADPSAFGATPEDIARVQGIAETFQATTNITINTESSATAEDIATMTKEAVEEAWDEQMRDAAAGTQ